MNNLAEKDRVAAASLLAELHSKVVLRGSGAVRNVFMGLLNAGLVKYEAKGPTPAEIFWSLTPRGKELTAGWEEDLKRAIDGDSLNRG